MSSSAPQAIIPGMAQSRSPPARISSLEGQSWTSVAVNNNHLNHSKFNTHDILPAAAANNNHQHMMRHPEHQSMLINHNHIDCGDSMNGQDADPETTKLNKEGKLWGQSFESCQ